jgi:hypothetical protein
MKPVFQPERVVVDDLRILEARIEHAMKKQAEDIAIDITKLEREVHSIRNLTPDVIWLFILG